jgi:hypothetical protein
MITFPLEYLAGGSDGGGDYQFHTSAQDGNRPTQMGLAAKVLTEEKIQ